MAKFRFRLATLRRLRETHRDEQRSRLAEAYQAETILTDQRQQVRDDIAQTQQLQRDFLATGLTDVNRLLDSQRYQLTLRAQQSALFKQSQLLTAEIERRRESVVEADRQVRVLDKLEDRQLQQHRLDQLRLETKQYDDIALSRVKSLPGCEKGEL